jgi:hypothetical protein
VDVVIPVTDEPSNQTLGAAVGSIRKHAPNLRVVLIGHVWPYIVPYAALGDVGIPMIQNRDTPIQNTNKAMQVACLSPEISDPFIWSNDDIYWRRPVDLEEMLLVSGTAKGRLPNRTYAVMEASAMPYGRYEMWQARTADMIRAIPGMSDWDYERHTPLLVEKKPMLHALEMGGDKRTLYGNLMRDEPLAIKPDTKIWKISDPQLPVEVEPFVSTGNGYPAADLPRMLELPDSVLDSWLKGGTRPL